MELPKRSIVPAVICAVLTAGLAIAQAEEPPVKVDIHNHGVLIQVPEPLASRISATIERVLESATDSAGRSDSAQWLRAHEVVVEVHYSAPRRFDIAWNHSKYTAQHLLVPMSGTWGESRSVVCISGGRTAPSQTWYGLPYGNPPDENGIQYGPGAYLYRGGNEELGKLVREAGVDLPHASRP